MGCVSFCNSRYSIAAHMLNWKKTLNTPKLGRNSRRTPGQQSAVLETQVIAWTEDATRFQSSTRLKGALLHAKAHALPCLFQYLGHSLSYLTSLLPEKRSEGPLDPRESERPASHLFANKQKSAGPRAFQRFDETTPCQHATSINETTPCNIQPITVNL